MFNTLPPFAADVKLIVAVPPVEPAVANNLFAETIVLSVAAPEGPPLYDQVPALTDDIELGPFGNNHTITPNVFGAIGTILTLFPTIVEILVV
jgi:hypothetical protein